MTTQNEQIIQSESAIGQATVQLWHDKARFIEAYSERWLANEAENMPFLRLGARSSIADSMCISIHDEFDNTVQTAVCTPHDQIIMSNAPEWAISALCSYLARENFDVPGIFAPAPTSGVAAKMLTRLTGKTYQLVKEMLHLELRQSPKSRTVAGAFRAAESQDVGHVAAQRQALQDESNTQRPFDSALSVRTDLRDGALYIWVDSSNRIVASGSLYRAHTPTSSYINHVYVEPKHRRQGYASALVSKLCECAIESGSVPCLSVDPKNQPAYQVYLQLGFTLVARMGNFRAAGDANRFAVKRTAIANVRCVSLM